MPEIITTITTKAASRHLAKDDVMKQLIETHGPCPLAKTAYQPFKTLAGSIIGQQLSVKAASTISGRVQKISGGPLSANRLHATSDTLLRSAGLSRAKTRYLKHLSESVVNRKLVFAKFRQLTDEEVIHHLTELPGIGRWTAEMFLIFGLKRQNILSCGDAGLRRAVNELYGKDIEDFEAIWKPYCSIASWYLWEHVDSA